MDKIKKTELKGMLKGVLVTLLLLGVFVGGVAYATTVITDENIWIDEKRVIVEGEEGLKQILTVAGISNAECNSTNWVDVPDMSIEITTTGGKVLVNHEATYYNAEHQYGFYIQILRDAELLRGSLLNGDAYDLYTMSIVDEPPAGTYTYKVRWKFSYTTDLKSYADEEYGNRHLTLIEV